MLDWLRAHPDRIVASTFEASSLKMKKENEILPLPDDEHDLSQEGISIVYRLCKGQRDWLCQPHCTKVFDAMVHLWQAPVRQDLTPLNVGLIPLELRKSKQMVKCFLWYFQGKPDDNLLFCMLNVFTYRSTIDYGFLREFYDSIAVTQTPAQKQIILTRMVDLLLDAKVKPLFKLQALQILVLPMLENSFTKCDPGENNVMLDAALVTNIVNCIVDYKPPAPEGGAPDLSGAGNSW